MVNKRIELHNLLKQVSGVDNIYFQPPDNLHMKYPAVVYKKTNVYTTKADNKKYKKMTRYEIIVIDTNPDSEIAEKILEIPYCSYSNRYVSEGFYHDILILFY